MMYLVNLGGAARSYVGSARVGDRGLGHWLLVNGCLHVGLLCASALGWALAETRLGGTAADLTFTVWIGVPIVTVPTLALSVILWISRGLPAIAFHALALGLVSLPLVLTPEAHQLQLLVPVQVAYALLIRRPQEWDWSERG